jgi:hypothetical protein
MILLYTFDPMIRALLIHPNSCAWTIITPSTLISGVSSFLGYIGQQFSAICHDAQHFGTMFLSATSSYYNRPIFVFIVHCHIKEHFKIHRHLISIMNLVKRV